MNGGPNGMMGGGQFGRGGLGTVTAVTDSSITIKDQRQDEETSYAITADTSVMDDSDDAAVSDIKVGDTVMIQSDDSESDTKTATTIRLNPSFGGRMQNAESSSSSSTESNI